MERIGKAIGEEAKEQNVDVVLGPGANLKRNPLCGRNFEYFSEDPYLSGKMAAGFIRGVEGQGIGTSLKHFAANSQEISRFTSDSILDVRTLRELYLTAFEIAVKEGKPSTVMCSYPKVNGIHSSDHKELLTDILRTEWGFRGMVITDWGAMNDRIEGFRAGCDLNMPGGSRPGGEVVQLYIAAPQQGLHRPIRELKRFQKVFLRPGESQTVCFTLDERAFAIWNNCWVVPGGCYEAQVGNLRVPMKIEGETPSVPDWQKGSFYETCKGKPVQREWETMLGRKYQAPVLKKGSFTMENTVEEMKDYSLIMKIMYKSTEAVIAKGFDGKKDYTNPDFKMMMKASAGGPLRSIQISSGMKDGLFEGLLEMANGHYLRGIRKMFER